MTTDQDARSLQESLVGQQITTLTGRPNTVLNLADADVLVSTDRAVAGNGDDSGSTWGAPPDVPAIWFRWMGNGAFRSSWSARTAASSTTTGRLYRPLSIS
jgi:hypothetical protein